jgi:DNA-binding MarR family transcriptional regulator
VSTGLPQDSLGFLVADVARGMRLAFAERLEGSGLSLAQARALLYVARHEGLRQVELAELLEVQPITLARLIDQLQEMGLVERRADPTDRRAYRIFLTAASAPRLVTIERAAALIRRQALRGIPADEAERITAALRVMRENIALGQVGEAAVSRNQRSSS